MKGAKQYKLSLSQLEEMAQPTSGGGVKKQSAGEASDPKADSEGKEVLASGVDGATKTKANESTEAWEAAANVF